MVGHRLQCDLVDEVAEVMTRSRDVEFIHCRCLLSCEMPTSLTLIVDDV